MAASIRLCTRGANCTFSVISALFRSSRETVTAVQNVKRVISVRQFSVSCSSQAVNQHVAEESDSFNSDRLEDVLREQHEDMPDQSLENPYQKPHKKCIICQYNVPLDYKNTKLLSQFVSPYTGQIYSAAITGLCVSMQKRISKLIRRARRFGLMAYLNKERDYLADPKLFNPFKGR